MDTINDRAKRMKARIKRFDKSSTGGASRMKFNSEPEDNDEDRYSMSGKILQRRFGLKEKRLKERLPRHRINFEEERGKRLEVSSLARDLNKKPGKAKKDREEKEEKKEEEKKSEPYRPYQNL